MVARNPRASAILDDAKGVYIESYNYRDNPRLAFQAMAKMLEWSEKKKQQALLHHQELERGAGSS